MALSRGLFAVLPFFEAMLEHPELLFKTQDLKKIKNHGCKSQRAYIISSPSKCGYIAPGFHASITLALTDSKD